MLLQLRTIFFMSWLFRDPYKLLSVLSRKLSVVGFFLKLPCFQPYCPHYPWGDSNRLSGLSFLSLCGDASAVQGTTDCVFEMTVFFRCRTLSGSPRPKNFKKIHFIKNMRQHDTRNGRYYTNRSCSPASVGPMGKGGRGCLNDETSAK